MNETTVVWGDPSPNPGMNGGGGVWGSSSGSQSQQQMSQPSSSSAIADITNLSKSNSVSSNSSSVWPGGQESGDNMKNSWNQSPVKNGLLGVTSSTPLMNPSNSTMSAQPSMTIGSDQENTGPVTPSSVNTAERNPVDELIYRKGWGQAEIKQDSPWPVPETPPPVNDDPSQWKPTANTGTDIWERNLNIRRQPWQQQVPNSIQWDADSSREAPQSYNSAWPSAAGPSMSSAHSSGPFNATTPSLSTSGTNILSTNGGSRSRSGGWDTMDRSSADSPSTSPTNENDWSSRPSDDQWSPWIPEGGSHGGGPKGDSGDPNGLGHWSSNQPGGYGQPMGGDHRKPPDHFAQPKHRPWSEGGPNNPNNMMRSRPEWNAGDDWARGDADKPPHWRDQPGGIRPPMQQNGARPDRIQETPVFRDLIRLGFKPDEIMPVIRDVGMNFDRAATELKRRAQHSSTNFNAPSAMGDMRGPAGMNAPGGMNRFRGPGPDTSIAVMAQQLSMAAKQGLISPNLLQQNLAPQTSLIHVHGQMQQLSNQRRQAAAQRMPNQAMLNQMDAQIQMFQREIASLQKEIDRNQMEYNRSSGDGRFQGSAGAGRMMENSTMDAASEWNRPVGPGGFANSAMPPPASAGFNQGGAMPGAGYGHGMPGWRPNEANMFVPMSSAGDTWNSMMNPMMPPPSTGAFGGAAPMNAMWGGGDSAYGMPYRPGAPPAMGRGMDDWSMASGPGGAGQMKMHQGAGGMMGGSVHGGEEPMSGGSRGGNASVNNGFTSEEGDGASTWGGSSTRPESSISSFVGARFSTWDSLPEFEPGKPWRGSQLLSADDDPHLTPGSVAKSPLG